MASNPQGQVHSFGCFKAYVSMEVHSFIKHALLKTILVPPWARDTNRNKKGS